MPAPASFRFAVAACLATAAIVYGAPADAQQTRAVVTANLNQRAGPDTHFPVLATVPQGSAVTLFGCLSDLSWCDGAYGRSRGWFSARYLTIPYGGTNLTVASYMRYAYIPAVAFHINSYWDSYYRDRPFYARLAFYADGGSVDVSIGSFYRPLASHGYWTDVRGRHVWVPRVEPGWRPYTDGRWVYTRRHGWTWVSHEPFGWATYHYGRWAYSARIGWFWVPGTRWAPAWVAWRRSDDYVAWAPLPPDPDDRFGFSIEISFGNIPNYYWQPVHARDFYAQDISTVVIGDNNQIINVINQTEPAGTVNIVNNIVVNNVIEVEYVEQQTGETVVARELALTASPDEDGEVTEQTVELYHPPQSELQPADAPEQIVPEEEVARESATAGQAGDEPATEDLVPPQPQPGEAPPEGPAAAGAPPLLAEGEEPEALGADQAPPLAEVAEDGPAPQGVEACPEGTVRGQDGSCAAPAADAPPAEEVMPEIPAEVPAVPEAQPPVLLPPAAQPAPVEGAQPAEGGATQAPAPCPDGTVRQPDGSCAAPPAEAPPAEQVMPETPAEPEPPQLAPPPAQPAPSQPPPQAQPAPQPQQLAPPQPPMPEPPQSAPPAPPQAPEPPPAPPTPAQPEPLPPPQPLPQSAPPSQQEAPAPQPPECPEGQVPDPQGVCVPQ